MDHKNQLLSRDPASPIPILARAAGLKLDMFDCFLSRSTHKWARSKSCSILCVENRRMRLISCHRARVSASEIPLRDERMRSESMFLRGLRIVSNCGEEENTTLAFLRHGRVKKSRAVLFKCVSASWWAISITRAYPETKRCAPKLRFNIDTFLRFEIAFVCRT